jgi:hypothetical protein
MQRGVVRQQVGRMHGEGRGQTAGRQNACRGEWPDSRQVGCMQRGVVRQQVGMMHAERSARQQAGGMHAEGSSQTAGRQDACRGE